ncbi:MAG TPA: PAS domain S-box protein [Caldisericia bacterium]|nr:PAS domain S-box protein [Caldisericia bacterium]HXK52079.1 PAS domain S-box protein [Caldisericia bacterium]
MSIQKAEDLEKLLQRIQESEKTYRNLFQNAQVGLFRTRIHDGKILESNEQLAKMFGYDDREKFLSEYITSENYVDEGTREKMLEIIKEKGFIKNFEARFYRKDKSIFWARYSARIYTDKGWIEGVAEDITDRKKIEEEIKKNNSRLDLAMTVANMAWWEMDVSTGQVMFSKKKAEMLAYAPEKFKHYKDFMALVHPDDNEKAMITMRKHLEGSLDKYEVEYRIKNSEGKYLWFYDIGAIVERDLQGKPLSVRGLVMNITERKRAEELLTESEQRFQKMLGVVPDMISIHSPDMDILYSNWQGFAAVPENRQKANTKCYKTYRNLDKICPDCLAKSVLETRKAFRREAQLPDGTWHDIRVIPFLDEDNNVVMFMEWVRDITDRKMAEEALRKSENLFQKVFDILPIGLWIADENGTLLQGNPAGVKIWGMEPKVCQSEYGVFKARRLPSGEEIKPNDWALAHTVNDGSTIVDELLEIDAFDGFTKIIVNYTAPILDDQGNIEGAIVVNRDITERYQAEEELRRIEWMLSKKTAEEEESPTPLYGDLSELNNCRLILDAVGQDVLKDIAGDFLGLLETSSAIYEKNGDYALGIFASSWCQFMDQASRGLCGTDDNKEALHCGKWLCHESCWKDSAKVAMSTGKPSDIECAGGIHMYAVPIFAGKEVVGAINFGYGDPPRDKETLEKLADKYRVPLEELLKKAKEYKSRPPYIIEIAKDRLQASANLIGEIVTRKIAEKELLKLNDQLEKKIAEKTQALNERVSELERFHDATIQREFRIKELREEIEQLKRNQK